MLLEEPICLAQGLREGGRARGWACKALGQELTPPALGSLSVLELTPPSMAPSVPASSAKGLMHCPGAVEDIRMGSGGVLLGYHIHPHQKTGAWPEDGGECPRQIYLSPELNFLMSQKNVCFSRVWADVVIQLW